MKIENKKPEFPAWNLNCSQSHVLSGNSVFVVKNRDRPCTGSSLISSFTVSRGVVCKLRAAPTRADLHPTTHDPLTSELTDLHSSTLSNYMPAEGIGDLLPTSTTNRYRQASSVPIQDDGYRSSPRSVM